MKDLLYGGAISKCQYGAKLLGNGANKIKALGIPINIEASDATT